MDLLDVQVARRGGLRKTKPFDHLGEPRLARLSLPRSKVGKKLKSKIEINLSSSESPMGCAVILFYFFFLIS